MTVILIPGFWLDASSWAPVTHALQSAGHTAQAITPVGFSADDPDREHVTLADQIADVVRLVDAVADDEPVVLVAHSGGGAVAHGVADARPDRIARVVYVDSGPLADGGVVNADLPVVDGMIPLPDWSFFGEDDLRDLTEALKADVRSRALTVPPQVAHGPLALQDERRYDVPVTVISSTIPAAVVRDLMTHGHPFVAELARITDVDIVELPTGHWPQFTRPVELAQVVVDAVDRSVTGS